MEVILLHVNDNYSYDHPQRRRLSSMGLHQLFVARTAAAEGVSPDRAKIVDSH